MFIDAHAHIDRYELVGEQATDTALKEISTNQILTFSNSMDVPSYRKNIELSEKCEWIIPLFGVHPWNAKEHVDQLDTLNRFIIQTPMIGEIGLDYFFVEDEDQYPSQLTVLQHFLASAEELNKIVHLHTKGAEKEVLSILQGYSLPGILIHWYSGPMDYLRGFLDQGAYFTVGIEINYSDHVRSIAEAIPLERLLTETDNPGGPKSYLGKPGSPSLILDVLHALASIRGIKEEELSETIQSNLMRFLAQDPSLGEWRNSTIRRDKK
jgi:TatD DNase family protein